MLRLLFVGFTLLYGCILSAQNFVFYYGNIHAHSGYSDGNKDSLTSGLYTPYEDFLYAKESEHIDFYGISEHNHSGAGMTSKQNYYNGVADAELATVADTFVALYGMEWGIISQGGHVLIYGYDSLIGWENNLYDAYVQPTDFNGLWNVINSKPNCFGYLAHPSASDFDSLLLKPWDFNADQAVVGLPFRSGPAFSQNITYSNPSTSSFWSRYTQALKQGYHVGIGLDHDSHYSVFGRSQQGRMGLLSPRLAKNDVMYALRKMRFFSTDDWNVRPDFRINEQPMGSIVTQSGNPTLFLDVVDLDLSEAVDVIFIYAGTPASGVQANLLVQQNGLSSLTYTDTLMPGETKYYYARIVQADGDEVFTSPIWYTRDDLNAQTPPVAHFSLAGNTGCVDVPLTLEYDGTGINNAYFWSFPTGCLPSYGQGSTPQVTFTQAGTFPVTVYVENAAGSSFYTHELTIEGCAGIVDHGIGFKMYPNPASSQLSIELSTPGAFHTLAIVDALGRTAFTYPLSNHDNMTFDIASLSTGRYAVRLLGEHQTLTESLWIER
jgi:hypothetical protein